MRHELQLRQEISFLTQLALLCLTSAHCTLPAARWFARQVLEAFTRASYVMVSGALDASTAESRALLFLQRRTEEPDIRVITEFFLPVESVFQGHEADESIAT